MNTAEDSGYFEIRQVTPWLVSFKDRLQVLCYLLTGSERALLFDTAYGIGDLPGAVRSVTRLPLTVLLSHGHADHALGAWQFENVLLHPADLAVFREYTGREWRRKAIDALRKNGILPEGYDEEAYLARNIPEPSPLDEGAVFDLGGLTARIVPMPGHTWGSVGLLVEEHRVLICGDAANRAVFLFLPESSGVRQYAEMLKTVSRLPFDTHLVSHAEGFYDRAMFDSYIKAADSARWWNSIPMRVPGFEKTRTLVRFLGKSIRAKDACGLVFTREKLKER